jgi:cytochrome c-type biogenesis protein CcmH
MLKQFLLALLLGLGAVLLASPLHAQDTLPPQATPPARPVTDDEVNAVAKQLFCPVCENVPLDVCPTQACAQWRGTIREKLEQGWTAQRIFDYFAAQYGERVLAQPSMRGLNIFIWVLPPVIVIAGAAVFWFYLRALTRRAAAPAPPPSAASDEPEADEYAQRLEQELKKRL